MNPFVGTSRNFFEINWPYATTTTISGFISLKNFNSSFVFRLVGLLATCIQHEMDHLEGILFIDYLSKLKKNYIVKKLSKQKKVLERIVV